MKYLPLRDFENVTSALNFDTSDCHVIGGCDLYTTKAAGNDKKLYKDIETSLESQHESLVRLSASLSPPDAEIFSLTLSRPSPFGPLSQVSSRRTFAYLIATLNASHPDYDFSHILRPSDFRKEKNLRSVMNTIDETLYNLRPRPAGALLAAPQGWTSTVTQSGPQTPGGAQTWGPKMWRIMDQEMTLRDCEAYCYSPDEDPFDGEENALWSLNYLFFNKNRKRVCYLYLRGLSIASHSPSLVPTLFHNKRTRPVSRGSISNRSIGASKRARYWLGDRADRSVTGGWDEDGEEADGTIPEPGYDELDEDCADAMSDGFIGFSDSEDTDEIDLLYRARSEVKAMSEDIADSVEMEL